MNGLRLTAAASIIAASAIAASATSADDKMPDLNIGLTLPATTAATPSDFPIANAAPFVPAPALSDLEGSDWQAISHLLAIDQPDELKRAFITVMLPKIRAVNETISLDRANLLRVTAILETGATLDSVDYAMLQDLRSRYRVDSLVELNERVAEIPEALALAQAALESGWGTSELAQESLSFFGHTRGNGDYAVFTSIEECISAYALNLNTHKAYADFRRARAGGTLSPWQIVATLEKYSELGRGYTKKVRGVMRALRPHEEDFLLAVK